jgi:hypothetical protein
VNVLDAIHDKQVFGQHFNRHPETWQAWFAFLATLFALPMTADQLAIYQQNTGRSTPSTKPFHEAWLVIGRRGGKSFILALIAVFLACFFDWRPFLGPGEVGTIMVIAQDRRGARTIMRFALGLLQAVPMLKQQIQGVTQNSITLKNNIVIEIHTASFRSTRGYTIVAALLDEIAYWPTDESSAEPDIEIINAIKPGMATIPGATLLCASSPHARRGALWEAWRKHFGKADDPVLVWQAATRDMNPVVPQAYIDKHMAEDPSRANAEYLAQFRSDLETYVVREAVAACISVGVHERRPQPFVNYHGFADPSGGSADSFALSIGHKDHTRQVVVVDALREIKAPFSPENAVYEFARLLKSYNVSRIEGDHYAGSWPVEQFRKFGILYEPSARPKSELYVDLLPLINSRRIELLDDSRLINQICALERRTARGGKDSIDHPPGAHDDLVNAVAGVAALNNKYGSYDLSYSWV